MCAFFASQIFTHPRLQNVTYYLRLDTDSYIYRPLCYDPIARFHAHNRSYGYRSRTTDPPFVTVGLWDLVDTYAQAHPEIEANMVQRNGWLWAAGRESGKMGEVPFPTYYNNFEIVRLDAFRRPGVSKWLEEVMSVPERVFKYRWGMLSSYFAFFEVGLRGVENDSE